MWTFTAATQSLMFLVNSGIWIAKGQSLASLYAQVPLFSLWILTLYHLLAVHALWYAPFYAWMMLVFAFARRAALLWAALIPLVIGGLEKLIFNTSHFGHMVLYRFGGGGEDSVSPSGSMPIDSMTHLTGEIRNDAWLVDRAHPLRHLSRHSGSIAPLARASARCC